jgi:hypothetical protein
VLPLQANKLVTAKHKLGQHQYGACSSRPSIQCLAHHDMGITWDSN